MYQPYGSAMLPYRLGKKFCALLTKLLRYLETKIGAKVLKT